MFGALTHRLCFVLLCTWCVLGVQSTSAARLIRDDRGLELSLSTPVKRIVSLYPSLTEGVCLLNACDRLVGVDRSSNWPEWVQSVPHLGGLWDTSLEDLVRLEPDVVIMSASNAKLTAKLERLGISVLVYQPQTWAQMTGTLRRLAQLIEPIDPEGLKPDPAQQLIDRMEGEWGHLSTQLAPWARGRRIYLQVGSGGYAASESSYLGQFLASLSLINVVPKALGEFPKMGREWLIRQSPDIIVMTHGQEKPLNKTPGLRALKAVKENRVCVLSQEESDRLLRLGPRVMGGMKVVVDCINKMRPL